LNLCVEVFLFFFLRLRWSFHPARNSFREGEAPITVLRQRLIKDMQVRNYSPRTVDAYVAAVAKLAKHFLRAPDQLTAATPCGSTPRRIAATCGR